IEIHVKSSDWYSHRHDKDPAYDSVLLHVVAIDDGRIKRRDGSLIPQVCVTFPIEFYSLYSSLSESINEIRCCHHLANLSNLVMEDWIATLAVERMQEKSERILGIHKMVRGDWEQTCFITIARALGFGLNSEPFEMMARSLPLNYLSRHSDNLFQLEALLFGQAGMLDMSNHIFDEYYQSLCREYYFLAKKYQLRPIGAGMWRYARTRPGNFPHRRIAMLAQYLYGGFSLMSDIIERGGDEEKSRELFLPVLDGYWETHSQFGQESGKVSVALSEGSIDLLLINLVAPLIYAHSASIGDYEGGERAINLWMSLNSEKNTYIRRWESYGLKSKDAMHSQGLLHLRKKYCDSGKCLECRFGHYLLRKSVVQWQ
ncbi:MAG: DUF2851 family protein, partial [Muribaculaceae bacterium]|nr:DUF2851 family protein [Muribaculaceae bacterium]